MVRKIGFTLIEVLVTSLILTIAMTGLLQSFVYCNEIIIRNTNRYNASMIINRHFEEIQRRTTPLDVENYINTITPSGSVMIKMQNTIEGSTEMSYSQPLKEYWLSFNTGNVVNPQTGTTLSIISATVSWENGGAGKNLSMAMFTNEPE